jgi:hypothetical protein
MKQLVLILLAAVAQVQANNYSLQLAHLNDNSLKTWEEVPSNLNFIYGYRDFAKMVEEGKVHEGVVRGCWCVCGDRTYFIPSLETFSSFQISTHGFDEKTLSIGLAWNFTMDLVMRWEEQFVEVDKAVARDDQCMAWEGTFTIPPIEEKFLDMFTFNLISEII